MLESKTVMFDRQTVMFDRQTVMFDRNTDQKNLLQHLKHFLSWMLEVEVQHEDEESAHYAHSAVQVEHGGVVLYTSRRSIYIDR